MEYKEYKANEPNVLLNIDTFEYCSYAMCNISTVLNFIEVEQEDGAYFNAQYRERIQNIQDDAEAIALVKQDLYKELVLKGYNIRNKVEPIIHN